MRKLTFLLVFVFMLAASAGFAFSPYEYVRPSAVYTADQNAIVSGAGYLYGILVMTDGTNSVTFKTYDSLTATGTKLHPDWVIPTSSTDRAKFLPFNPPIGFSTGLSVDITTSGSCSYILYYREQ